MDSSRADGGHYHGVLQDMAAQTSYPNRVFPDYIYINWEGYMRTADPFWEANRPATSCMYQARVNTQGQINTTNRMQKWLCELPEPEPKLGPEPQPPKRGVQHTKPRSLSATTPPPGQTPRPVTSPTPGVANQSPIKRFHHPNPLSQHPVKQEELPPPFKIPRRKSSLQYTSRVAQQLNPPTYTSAHQQSDLVQRVQKIQLGEPVEFRGTMKIEDSFDKGTDTTQLCNDIEMADVQQTTADSRSASASKRHTVQFGEMLESLKGHLPMDETDKHNRSESTTVADSQPPQKRQRGRFGSIRNRLSIVGTPVRDTAQDGRKSSASTMIRDLGQVSKGLLGKLAFVNTKKNVKIRVAFIGDGHCGKTNLLHRLTTGAFLGENVNDGVIYNRHMAGPVEVDNYSVTLEAWDISAHLTVFQTNPLTLSYFDATVICFDVTDEANLASVTDKWQHEANVFTPRIPVILLGLKSDLRPPYRTLKLRFLGEDDDQPPAATVGQGESTAQSIKAAAYFECSARTGEGVADFLESLIRISISGIEARRNKSKARKAEARKMNSFFRRK